MLAGVYAPSAKPITMRTAMSVNKPVAKPLAPMSNENATMDATSTKRRPMRSDIFPMSSAAVPHAMARAPVMRPMSR